MEFLIFQIELTNYALHWLEKLMMKLSNTTQLSHSSNNQKKHSNKLFLYLSRMNRKFTQRELNQRYKLRKRLRAEWKEIPPELPVMRRKKAEPTENDIAKRERSRAKRARDRKENYRPMSDVIAEYWRDKLSEDYIHMRLHDFLRKYKVYRQDARDEFWLKTSRDILERIKSYTKTDTVVLQEILHAYLVKMWAMNKVINDNYKYEPVYTHKPSIQLPLFNHASYSPAQEYLKKKHVTPSP